MVKVERVTIDEVLKTLKPGEFIQLSTEDKRAVFQVRKYRTPGQKYLSHSFVLGGSFSTMPLDDVASEILKVLKDLRMKMK